VTRKIEGNWYRWDVMFNNKEFHRIIKEIDEMVARGGRMVVGDIVRRDNALKEIGVDSISTLSRIKKGNNDKK